MPSTPPTPGHTPHLHTPHLAPRALPRTLGLWSAIAERLPGPLPLRSIWIVGGLFALCGALTLAEVAGAIPETGGVYVYLREGWGRLAAFLFGWTELVVIRAASLGAISITFAEYALRAFGIDTAMEPWTTRARFLAAAAIALMAIVNIRGIRWGSFVQNLTSIAKYFGLVVIVGLAFAIGLPKTGGHFTPAVPPGSFSIAPFGLALVSVLWAYDGWADLSFIGGEVKDPRRNLPRALILGTLAIIGIYLLANVAYLSVMSIDEIRQSPRVAADVAQRLVGPVGVLFVAVTVMLSTFGTLNGSILTSPRIFYAMADDGLFFRKVASVHPKYDTPWVAITITAMLGIAFVLMRTFEQLADAFVTAIIPFYALGVASIYVLRKRPDYDPPFRVPGYPVVPAIFVLATIMLLGNAVMDPGTRWATLAVFGVIVVGIPVYYLTVGKKGRA